MSTTTTTPAQAAIEKLDLSHETLELLKHPRDLYEASHEHADNNEQVIYTYKAMELVNRLSSYELGQAEAEADELRDPSQPQSIGELSTLIAFCHIRQAYQEQVREDLEQVVDKLDELQDELTDELEELQNKAEQLDEEAEDLREEGETEQAEHAEEDAHALEGRAEAVEKQLEEVAQILDTVEEIKG